MTVFFTSDHHFGHANILRFEDESRRNVSGGRFQTIAEHDERLIELWNETVSADDTVYCLGDFSYKQHTMEAVLPRMNGKKILIAGNHDPYFKRLNLPHETKMYWEAHEDAYRAGFTSVQLELDMEIAGIGMVRLSHFPYWPTSTEGVPEYDLRNEGSRPAMGKSALLLHGHVHSQWQWRHDEGRPPMINVGIDMWGMRPIPEHEIVQLYKEIAEAT